MLKTFIVLALAPSLFLFRWAALIFLYSSCFLVPDDFPIHKMPTELGEFIAYSAEVVFDGQDDTEDGPMTISTMIVGVLVALVSFWFKYFGSWLIFPLALVRAPTLVARVEKWNTLMENIVGLGENDFE